MIEVSQVRRQLRQTIEQARQAAADRRQDTEQVERAYRVFLQNTALPVFRTFANALKAEGYLFSLVTPSGKLQLVREGTGQDFIELELDLWQGKAVVMGRWRYSLGRDVTDVEQPIREEARAEDLTEDDVLAFLLLAVRPFVEK